MVTPKDLSVWLKANPALVLGIALGMGIVPEKHSRCYLFTDDDAARLGARFAEVRGLIRPQRPKPRKARQLTTATA